MNPLRGVESLSHVTWRAPTYLRSFEFDVNHWSEIFDACHPTTTIMITTRLRPILDTGLSPLDIPVLITRWITVLLVLMMTGPNCLVLGEPGPSGQACAAGTTYWMLSLWSWVAIESWG